MNSSLWKNITGSITYKGTDKTNVKALETLSKEGFGWKTINPTSYRISNAKQNRDSKGRYMSGFKYSNTEIAPSMDKPKNKDQKLHGVESSAIASASYNPQDDSLNITYKTNPTKEYKFKAGGEEGLQEWLNAPSKGRITQEWKTTHRWPGY